MKKKVFCCLLVAITTVCYTWAGDFNNTLNSLKGTVDSSSSINTITNIKNLKKEFINRSTQIQKIMNNEVENDEKNEVENTNSTTEGIVQEDDYKETNIADIVFFGGLKPDSSIVDVINTFKKYDSVTNIELRYNDKTIADNDIVVNFKNKASDNLTISKYLEKFIPDGFYIQRYNQKVEDYTTMISFMNGQQGRMTSLTSGVELYINKMYIDGIPFTVRADFVPSEAFYSMYPEKVLVGPTKHIAYPFIIERLVFDTDNYNNAVQDIAKEKRDSILNKYIEKYGVVRDRSCYDGEHSNDFIAIQYHPNFAITYKNYTYTKYLNNKYADFKKKKTMQEGEKLNSSNDI